MYLFTVLKLRLDTFIHRTSSVHIFGIQVLSLVFGLLDCFYAVSMVVLI